MTTTTRVGTTCSASTRRVSASPTPVTEGAGLQPGPWCWTFGRGSLTQPARAAPETNAASRPRAPRRSLGTSTEARRARCRRGALPGARALPACRTSRCRRSSRRTRSRPDAANGRSRRAARPRPRSPPCADLPSLCRPASGVRETDPVAQELVRLLWPQETRGELGSMKQSPEVVTGIGERRSRGRAHASGVDAAEDHANTRPQNVRDSRSRGHTRILQEAGPR